MDIQDEYLEDVALGILSGETHPFLVNDEKIISSLLLSGEGIDDEESNMTYYMLVVEKARDCWSSSVVLKNYGCDGSGSLLLVVGSPWVGLYNVSIKSHLESRQNIGIFTLEDKGSPSTLYAPNKYKHWNSCLILI